MCGRYTLTSVDGLIEEFSLIQERVLFAPRYNIAPGERIPVIDNRPKGERVLVAMRWGLVPRWAKDPSIGNRMVNARCETVAEKPSFRQAFERRRCIVVADGFYEWQRRGKVKAPHYIRRRDRGYLAMAGLWERWRAPDESSLVTCTVVTTAANELLAPIHDRMPLLLERADYDRWLAPDPLPRAALDDLLRPPDAAGYEAYEVARLVNSVANDAPACIAPASPG